MPSSLCISGKSFFGALAMPRLNDDLRIEEVKSFGDFLFLRALRNQVRLFMTNDTVHISYAKQIGFYLRSKCSFNRSAAVKIFIARYKSLPVGYLLVRITPDGAVLTEAIDENFRQRGIGKKLVAFAQQNYDSLLAEIRHDNRASITLHESMGFRREAEKPGIVVYRFRRN
jgi:ribosomal protein S18 acetylase RimI-like enzyme